MFHYCLTSFVFICRYTTSFFSLFLIVQYHISLFVAHHFLVLSIIYCMLCHSLYILLYEFICFMVFIFFYLFPHLCVSILC